MFRVTDAPDTGNCAVVTKEGSWSVSLADASQVLARHRKIKQQKQWGHHIVCSFFGGRWHLEFSQISELLSDLKISLKQIASPHFAFHSQTHRKCKLKARHSDAHKGCFSTFIYIKHLDFPFCWHISLYLSLLSCSFTTAICTVGCITHFCKGTF